MPKCKGCGESIGIFEAFKIKDEKWFCCYCMRKRNPVSKKPLTYKNG